MFQRRNKPANTPKLIEGKKKTVYKKHGKFGKNNTEGTTPYTVDALSDDKSEARAAFKKRLQKIRENARIKKKIELENSLSKKNRKKIYYKVVI